MNINVYLDTDVIISALLTPNGVSADLFKSPQITKYLSNTSKLEIIDVSQRKNINPTLTSKIISPCNSIFVSQKDIDDISDYVNDPEDQPILAGAIKSGANFLATYNIRDFKVNRIHQDFGIIILIPGHILQHLRSL